MTTKILNKVNGCIKSVEKLEDDVYLGQVYRRDTPHMPVVGREYMVWIEGVHQSETLCWDDDPRLIDEGMPGNSDRSVCRHVGWRGTTDGIAIYAMGVRKCIKSEISLRAKHQTITCEFGARSAD